MVNTTKQLVESVYEAWRTGDTSKFHFSKDFTFDGPMASFTSPDQFIAMAGQFMPMVKSVKILDAVYEDNKAFVMLNFETNIPQVGGWIAIDYYMIESGKIKYSRTSYDPRKLAEFMQSR